MPPMPPWAAPNGFPPVATAEDFVPCATQLRLRTQITPACSTRSRHRIQKKPLCTCSTVPDLPVIAPSAMRTMSSALTGVMCWSIALKPRVLFFRCPARSAKRKSRTSGSFGVPPFVRTRHVSASIWITTPAVCASTITKSCSLYPWKAALDAIPAVAAAPEASTRSRVNTRYSSLDASDQTDATRLSSTARMRQTAPVCGPRVMRTLSPTLNCFSSWRASNGKSSLSSS
mmetsp:Transcript_989/g.2177  ORF Transcript_989/g.2177 Transcript_989/m.2177 type:complete len:230 (+) Transcript_989:1266-1955(+)